MLARYEETGVKPEGLRNRPVLDYRQVYYYNIYQRVAGSRRVSMSGALPIPVSEIRSYCDLFKIHNVEHIEAIFDRITHLDSVYLDHAHKEAEKTRKK